MPGGQFEWGVFLKVIVPPYDHGGTLWRKPEWKNYLYAGTSVVFLGTFVEKVKILEWFLIISKQQTISREVSRSNFWI